MMFRMGWLLPMVVLAGCPRAGRKTDVDPSGAGPPTAAPGPVRRGGELDGEYRDAVRGYAIPVPPGWQWTEGPPDVALQLRLEDPASGTAVEVWRFSGTDYSLRPRQDCTWTFDDRGPYLGPGGMGDHIVGSCVPGDPTAPRVFGWMVETPEAAWQLEGHVPPAAIVRGLAAVRSVIERFRFEDGA